MFHLHVYSIIFHSLQHDSTRAKAYKYSILMADLCIHEQLFEEAVEHIVTGEQLSQSTTDFKLLNLTIKTCIDEIAVFTQQTDVFIKRTNPVSSRSFDNRLADATAKLIKISYEIEQRLSTFYLKVSTLANNENAGAEGSTNTFVVKSTKSNSTTEKEPTHWSILKPFSNKNSVSSMTSTTTTASTPTIHVPQLSTSMDRYAVAPDHLTKGNKKIQPLVEGDEREGNAVVSDSCSAKCVAHLNNCIIS